MDVYSYVAKYNMSNFDSSNLTSLRKELEMDFVMDMCGAISTSQKQQVVYNTIQKLAYFRNVSNGRIDVSMIWKNMFTNIIIKYAPNKDKSFYDLYNFFDNTKWFYREMKEVKKNVIEDEEVKEILEMFGLNKRFTEVELRRSFRKLCLKYHPDKQTGSVEKFNDLQKKRIKLEKYLLTRSE